MHERRVKPNAVFAGAVLSIVAILIVPLPPCCSMLLGLNIFGSALVLLFSLRVEEPLEFSVFAPALLFATLFRLSLDVSATRLILTQGSPGRRRLDHSGLRRVRRARQPRRRPDRVRYLDHDTVRRDRERRAARRGGLGAVYARRDARQADGDRRRRACRGARRRRRAAQTRPRAARSRLLRGDGRGGEFVKGDAVAALVIVALNLAGGLVVGVAYYGMGPLDALQTFAILSIGNALVTTLPAFLISTSMGLMVTRVAGEGALGVDLAAQLFARPDALRTAGGLMVVLAFVPALPRPVFGALGWRASRRARRVGARRRRADDALRAPRRRRKVDSPPGIAFASGRRRRASRSTSAPNSRGCSRRRTPSAPRPYRRRAPRARGGDRDRHPRCPLARRCFTRARHLCDSRSGSHRRRGAAAPRSPAGGCAGSGARARRRRAVPRTGLRAEREIDPAGRTRARANAGALAFDAISIVGSHLSEIVRANAAELFGRQEFQTLLEHLRATVPSIVKDVGTDLLPVATRCIAPLRCCCAKRAWPRDPIAVFEAMLDAAPHHREPRELAERAGASSYRNSSAAITSRASAR